MRGLKRLADLARDLQSFCDRERSAPNASDHRSDIFALGTILYEMLAGERAFHRVSGVDTMTAILKENPPDLSERIDNLPPVLSRIVFRCLEKDPADRFQTSRDLSFALDSISDLNMRPVVTKSAEGRTSERSIAVLPFKSMSSDQQNDYFSEGLAEDLINALTRLRGLRVASRTASFRFRGPDLDLNQIGRQLNVDSLLEGSVRRAGNRLRISVQLVDVNNGHTLWSERYDREISDIFEVQDDITASIVKMLEPTLLGKQESMAKRHSDNIQALELYLKGRHFWHLRSHQAMQAGVECFEKAIQVDPDYALAHAGVADSFAIMRLYGWVPAAAGKAKAEAAAERAMQLDAGSPEVHFAAAMFKLAYAEDWHEADSHFVTALKLNPNSSVVQGYYSHFLAAIGRFDEARAYVKKCTEADPLSPFVHGVSGLALYDHRRYEEAVRLGERSVELQPDFPLGLWPTGLASCKLGRYDRAVEALDRAATISRRTPLFVGFLGFVYARAGRLRDARACIEELQTRTRDEYVYPFSLLMIYLGLADDEKTYEQLHTCVEDHVPGFGIQTALGPYLDELFEQPRLHDLLSRLRLIDMRRMV